MYTHDEILAMSEDELNRAIAEAKGWKIENYSSRNDCTIS